MKLTARPLLALGVLLAWPSQLVSAAHLALAARADVPVITVSDNISKAGKVVYCEPVTFNWANASADVASTIPLNILRISVFNEPPADFGSALGNSTRLLYTAEERYVGESWTWVPDLQAGQRYVVQIDNSSSVRPNTSDESWGYGFSGVVQNSSRPCNQSTLRLPYDSASVVVSAGLRSISVGRPASAAAAVILAGALAAL